jgi:hypothetical protein
VDQYKTIILHPYGPYLTPLDFFCGGMWKRILCQKNLWFETCRLYMTLHLVGPGVKVVYEKQRQNCSDTVELHHTWPVCMSAGVERMLTFRPFKACLKSLRLGTDFIQVTSVWCFISQEVIHFETKAKVVPLHAMEALRGRGSIAATHSWPRQ